MKTLKLRRTATLLLAMLGLLLTGPLTASALACPMCKIANEEDDPKPRAYMYSILFMLAVPGTMVGGMTVGLVMMGRREGQDVDESALNDPSTDEA